MAVYTQKCEQKWLKINNRRTGGGTIIRDSGVAELVVKVLIEEFMIARSKSDSLR